ncbi:MAG: hypothetical protein P4L75_07495 [Clostridia bacterium]|nr:hypothetical protein [Clostridia bacterium]MDR3644132.1 hypothetical protein [Clostridia bacterium]
MRKKRSSFWTILFSFLPGAGHMFMGFMKIGLSLMTAFFAIIAFSTWLNIGPLLYLLPILWCYSFFDSFNRRFSSDAEFSVMEDRYLFSLDKLVASCAHHPLGRLIAGIVLLLLGVYLALNNTFEQLYIQFPQMQVFNRIEAAMGVAPQIVAGVAIIVLGVWLIVGRGRRRGDNV